MATKGILAGVDRERNVIGVAEIGADLLHGPVGGKATVALPAEPIPADEPPRQRQRHFRIGAARLGMRGTLEVRAVGQLAHYLHRPLQRKNAVPTVIADVQSRPTNSTNVVFHFQNHTRASGVFGPAVTHGSPPWHKSTARCNCTLS